MATKVKITVSKGPQGTQGEQGFRGFSGYSAYDVWLTQGNTGTVHDYLTSLEGVQGVQGDQGIQGVQGETGTQGIQGETGPQGIQGETGVVADLNSVPDVDTNGGVTGQVLTQQSDGSFALENVAQSLFDLTDTEQAGAIAPSSTLTYIGGKWKNTAPASPPPSPTLANLTDTVLTTPADGQFLKYNGTEWINAQVDLPWTATGSDIYYNTGNVGIGTTTPAHPLDVTGRVNATNFNGVVLANNDLGRLIVGDGSTSASSVYATSVGMQAGMNSSGNYGTFVGYYSGVNSNGNGNTAVGNNSGRGWQPYSNSRTFNASVGMNAGYGPGHFNANIGAYSGPAGSPLESNDSAAVGYYAGRITGSDNVSIGSYSNQGASKSYNVSIGSHSNRHTSGNNNVVVGYEAGLGVTGTSTFANTVAVGYQALTALTTGAGNTAVGYQAGAAITTGSNNTLIGHETGGGLTTGQKNVEIGKNNKTNNNSYRVSVGYNTGGGNESVAIGDNALTSSTGTKGIAIGRSSGGNFSGSHGIFIGYEAGAGVGSGNYNVFLGFRQGKGANNKNYNVSIGGGSYALGHNNVVLGYQAGQNLTTSSDGNVLLGYQAGNAETGSNKLYIENSNSATPLIYGEFDNDILRVNGTLQVNDPASTGYAFPTATGTLGQVLEVNASGDLAFATPSGGGGGVGTADQTLDADRTIDTNGFNLDIELDPTGTADTFTIHDGTHDLFQVDTTTTGTLFGVNDVSGLPMFQSNSDGTAALPQILTAAPTVAAPEGTMQFGIVSSTCYLYVYLNGGWKSTTLT